MQSNILLLAVIMIHTVSAAVQVTELQTTYRRCEGALPDYSQGPLVQLHASNTSYFAFNLFQRPDDLQLATAQFVTGSLQGTVKLLARKIVIGASEFDAMDNTSRLALYNRYLPTEHNFDLITIVEGSFPSFNLFVRGLSIQQPLAYASLFVVAVKANDTLQEASFHAFAIAGDNGFYCDVNRVLRDMAILGAGLGLALLLSICCCCCCTCIACCTVISKRKQTYQQLGIRSAVYA